MNRFSNFNRSSPGQGGRFRGGENFGGGRAPKNTGGRKFPLPPPAETGSIRDFRLSSKLF